MRGGGGGALPGVPPQGACHPLRSVPRSWDGSPGCDEGLWGRDLPELTQPSCWSETQCCDWTTLGLGGAWASSWKPPRQGQEAPQDQATTTPATLLFMRMCSVFSQGLPCSSLSPQTVGTKEICRVNDE